MGLFTNLYPKEYYNSTYEINFEALYQAGYRGIIFDVDNTLVPHGAPADQRAMDFFNRLKVIGFKCVLLSNNDEERVKSFNDQVHVNYIYKANKPSPKGYIKACRLMETQRSKTLFVGDQIFTDVWGANRAGIHSIMVKYMNPKEEIQIILKRKLEAIVLFFYNRSRKKLDN